MVGGHQNMRKPSKYYYFYVLEIFSEEHSLLLHHYCIFRHLSHLLLFPLQRKTGMGGKASGSPALWLRKSMPEVSYGFQELSAALRECSRLQ